jgi:hypothetical protein
LHGLEHGTETQLKGVHRMRKMAVLQWRGLMRHEMSETLAKETKRLVNQISSALLGPIAGKMPKSCIDSLEKFSFHGNISSHIVDIIAMTEAEIARHDVDPAFPPFIRKEAVFGKRNLYVLADAVVSPLSGMVWIENRILEESVGSLRRIMHWGDVLHEPLLPVKELTLEEPVVVCHPASYYHWLLEVLPNLLFAISKFPDARIVVPEDCPAYIIDGLATAMGPEATRRLLPCSGPVRVQTLLMPQYHNVPEFAQPQVVRLLQSEVKRKVLTERLPPARAAGGKIYISRQKAGRRRLGGEALLEGMMRERGFTILHCEELSFQEQIRIFHQAETVVACHGAGLSNLVWSEAPCRVIEIFPRNYILDCFSWLSFSLGLDYRYVICKTGHKIDEDAIGKVLALL